MQDSEIYSKTDAGREEIRTRARHLPGAIRAILLMVDGQRTVAQFRDIIAGSKAPPDTLETLLAQGLIEARMDYAASNVGAGLQDALVPGAAAEGPLPGGEAPGPLAWRDAMPPSPAVLQAGVPAAASQYDRLYSMMSEIVRDFLAPHRRYFIQLKIEKCSNTEELLELLDELRVPLAKARGEAFAADIISRLRTAAH